MKDLGVDVKTLLDTQEKNLITNLKKEFVSDLQNMLPHNHDAYYINRLIKKYSEEE